MKISPQTIRLYLDPGFNKAWQQGEIVLLDHAQTHYLVHVMRCVQGDALKVFHQDQGEWQATIDRVIKSHGYIRLDHLVRCPQSTLYSCHLACAPLRQNRLDLILEKACELGMTRFTPLVTDHAQVRQVSPARLRKIAIESSEQSERLTIPTIDPVQSLDSFLKNHANQPLYVAWERHAEAESLWRIAQEYKDDAIWMIGPEGGWSTREKQCFLAHAQVCPVNLGPTILRSETAAVMVLSVWNSWYQYRSSS